MKERMQRNDCPNEETNQALAGDAGDEYATALASVLDEDTASPAGDDYLAALNTLEAKEAQERERARLAPVCEEYLAAIEQYFNTQSMYALAHYDGESFDQSRIDAATRRMRDAATSVGVDFDNAIGAAKDVWYKEAKASSIAEARNKVRGAIDASRDAFLNHGDVCGLSG